MDYNRIFLSDVINDVEKLGWNIEIPALQQKTPRMGDELSQALNQSLSSQELSQNSQSSQVSQNEMFKRYLMTKPLSMLMADKSRYVSSRRHVIGKFSNSFKCLIIFRTNQWLYQDVEAVLQYGAIR